MSSPTALPPSIEANRDQLVRLCGRFSVRRLELFGSAADGTFDPERSDLDFLVAFHRSPKINAFHQYFDFQDALEELFGRKIDLVEEGAMRNPYFIRSVNKSRTLIYGA